jgi:hypothetical protein
VLARVNENLFVLTPELSRKDGDLHEFGPRSDN